MNPISEFLLFDVEAIANINISWIQSLLAIVGIIHALAWFFVLLFLPFKLLSWIFSNNKG